MREFKYDNLILNESETPRYIVICEYTSHPLPDRFGMQSLGSSRSLRGVKYTFKIPMWPHK